jgi:hypothetical protein
MSLVLREEGGEGKTLFKKWIEGLSDEIEDEVSAELDSVLELIKNAAIEMCPKDTGALASSITIGNTGIVSAGDFYGNSISVGSEDVINPKTGISTAFYASLVHDGHAMRNGEFWEGIPFLDEAMLMYFEELERAVDRALKEVAEKEGE